MNIEELNAHFGNKKQLKFVEDASGIVMIEIENTLASARVCLQGAQLKTWRPRTTSIPVVWLPEDAQCIQGKSLHGGAPICWPWFGVHATEKNYPAHGFARVAPWQLIAVTEEADGATRLVLQMQDSPLRQQYWPQASELTLAITIGHQLSMQLTTKNTGKEAFSFTEAIHTYFQISDIEKVSVLGLAGCTYIDTVGERASRLQEGNIRFVAETDRIYINSESECMIEDTGLMRKIRIIKKGSHSTVVWTPWTEKANKLADLASGWRQMVCVESGNAAVNQLTLPAGESHVLAVEYSTTAL